MTSATKDDWSRAFERERWPVELLVLLLTLVVAFQFFRGRRLERHLKEVLALNAAAPPHDGAAVEPAEGGDGADGAERERQLSRRALSPSVRAAVQAAAAAGEGTAGEETECMGEQARQGEGSGRRDRRVRASSKGRHAGGRPAAMVAAGAEPRGLGPEPEPEPLRPAGREPVERRSGPTAGAVKRP
jgi:hypothetical protein